MLIHIHCLSRGLIKVGTFYISLQVTIKNYSLFNEWNNPIRSIALESEDKSLALPGNIVESLVAPSCDPKETLRMDQTDLEQATPETTAKDSNQSYVVKLLRDITLAGATGKFADSICLSVNSFIHQLYVIRRTMNLAVMLTFIKHHHCFSEKLTYHNRSLWCKIEKFIKSRFPCRPFLLEVPCMN